ncbi:hypothetical protein RND71_042229 [Anisodus tanguticus]|uniref:C2 domain-containing protein n=1 Tax=Anisodus tanguticus TaxID=243964 RepID=A0AAE1QTA7_9SOLA|nr:hypothetical protein RND71_042229 [Anisodus tanguticus]
MGECQELKRFPSLQSAILSLSASKLRDLDIVSKSDPMAVVSVRKRDGTLEELGRTEVIMNNLDPDLKLKDQDFLGEGSCVLSELYYGESPVLASDLDYKDICPSKDIVLEALQGHKCSNKSPICYHGEETDVDITTISFSIVTKRNRSLTLNLHNRNGHVLKNLGELTVLAEETVTSRTAVEMTFRCTNLENKDLFSKSDPFLRISRIVETGGSFPICKTEVVNNNLNPIWRPVCLTMQQFVNKAIMEVGDVIQFYDSDKRFPAWGFGGKAYSGTVSHCFNLAGSPGAFEVEGVGGIMASYASALQNFTLSGPTLFGHVVNKAAEIAAESLKYNQSKYFVLLIITDGVLTDMQETKDALVRASDLPLSILIVGVGSSDFTQMETR